MTKDKKYIPKRKRFIVPKKDICHFCYFIIYESGKFAECVIDKNYESCGGPFEKIERDKIISRIMESF